MDCTISSHEAESEVDNLKHEVERQKIQITKKDNEIAKLKFQLSLSKFGIERFGSDDSLVKFYTGFDGYHDFKSVFTYMEPSARTMKMAYYVPSETVSFAGRPRTLLLIDEFFLFLCRLRQEKDLTIRFNISQSSVSRILISWVNFLYFMLGKIDLWLPRTQVNDLMPNVFKEKYGTTRVIIDCTEIKCQMSSSLVANSQFYSAYKSYTTLKGLVGIAPHGAVTFISSLFTGSISDIEITKLSGILDLLEEGDSGMADKGFTITKYLREKKVGLNLPAFLRQQGQFTPEQIAINEEIASLRIHVERYIRRVKEYHLFDGIVPLTLTGSINQFWAVACILANFRGPLIKKK